MASTGQGSTQAPQSMHSVGLMKSMRSSSVPMMQSTGQTSTQDLSLTSMQVSPITKVIAGFPPSTVAIPYWPLSPDRIRGDLHSHPIADHGHPMRLQRQDRGQIEHVPGPDVEPRAVAGALHQMVGEVALAQRAVLVGAGVVDGVPTAIFGMGDANGQLAHDHPTHAGDWYLGALQDGFNHAYAGDTAGLPTGAWDARGGTQVRWFRVPVKRSASSGSLFSRVAYASAASWQARSVWPASPNSRKDLSSSRAKAAREVMKPSGRS